jgi:hypothetical protein
MLRKLTSVFGLFLFVIIWAAATSNAAAQAYNYTSPKAEFSVEFPSATWKKVGEPDDVHQHTEFVYGDRWDGYLRIRKETLPQGMSVKEFALRDQDEKTRFLPGFVAGKDDPFNGRLDGTTVSYEFTQAGKPMTGRSYYLKADAQTVYVLRFTGLRNKLLAIRNQTDSISRSLQLK